MFNIDVNPQKDLENYTMKTKHEKIISEYSKKKKKYENKKKTIGSLKKKKVSNPDTESDRLKNYKLDVEIDNINNLSNIEEEEEKYYLATMNQFKNYYDPEQTNNADIYNEYLHKIKPTYFPDLKKYDNEFNWCNKCNIEKEVRKIEGFIVCLKCGESENIIVTDNKETYVDGNIPQENTCIAYKKQTHLKEWLDQIQGKERTEIPNHILDKIIKQIKIEGIKNIKTLTNKQLKEILKELKLAKYYEHIPYILITIGGQKPPDINPEVIETLEKMFNEILRIFKTIKSKERNNFISYSYVLHKCAELIGEDELLPYFPLLKSNDKLRVIDEYWKQCCKKLGYEFIPSI